VLILGRSLFLAIKLQLSPKPYFGHETPKLISLPIELSKPDNFGHKAGFKGGFAYICFFKDNGNMIKSLKMITNLFGSDSVFLAENTAGEAPTVGIILNKNKDCTKKPQKRGKKTPKNKLKTKKTILRHLYTTDILGAFAH